MLRIGLAIFILLTAFGDSASAQVGPPVGPRVRSWYGPWYGPGWGFGPSWGWGWGNPWLVPLAWSNGYWYPGLWPAWGGNVPLGPQPGAFNASGGYGIGGGIYGAQKDLPTLIPKAPPRFATRDVKNHFNTVIQQPQIAIQRQYWIRSRFGP